jgi:hypothetical protein
MGECSKTRSEAVADAVAPRGGGEPLATLLKAQGSFVMTKESRKELEREIVASVKREMDKPRLTESVRNRESGLTAPAVPAPALR